MADRETVTGQASEQDTGQRAARTPAPLPPPSIGGESVTDTDPDNGPQFLRTDPDTDIAAPPLLFDKSSGADTGEAGAGLSSSDPLTAGVGASAPPVSGAGLAAGGRARVGDKVFRALSAGSSGIVVLLVVLVGVFLVVQSVPAIVADKDNFLTSDNFVTTDGDLHFGIAGLLYATVMISLIAMIIAVPISIGIALFMTQYAPKRLAKPVAYVIDLLAAIPSIIYGIWGIFIFTPHLEGVQRFLSHIPGPLFELVQQNRTIFDGGVVLAIMVLPIITAISRDVFERTPRANIEAALALGATKWEMIRMAVLPYGRAGVVSGAMLGLGRALGETIAVLLIVGSVSPPLNFSIFNGGDTFASKIANNAAEFTGGTSTGAYIAAGLVLFVLTFIVNAAARAIVNRKKDFR